MARKQISDEQRLAINERRHLAADHRWLVKQDRADAQREEAIRNLGQLCREGKTVFYTFPVGGEYRESADPDTLV